MDKQRETIDACAKTTAAALLRLSQYDVRGACYLMQARSCNGIRISSEVTPDAALFWDLVAEDLAFWDFIMIEAARQQREEPVRATS